jgi:hypothetical protein
MPNIHKILGQINPSANTQTNVYVVPASTASLINSIHVDNLGAANATYSIIVIPSSDDSTTPLPKHFILRGSIAPTGDTVLLDFPLTLPAGTVVAANTNGASLAISAFGVEVS